MNGGVSDVVLVAVPGDVTYGAQPGLHVRNRPSRVGQPAGAGRMDRLDDHRPVCMAIPRPLTHCGESLRGEHPGDAGGIFGS